VAVSKTRMKQIIREELTRAARDPHLREQALPILQAAKAAWDQYSPEASAQGLSTGQKASYVAARTLGGAVPTGARQVAMQGGKFYADVLRDTWKNNKMDMLDWGLTAASLAASMSLVGAPIAIALTAASAVKNVSNFAASGFKDIGAAIGVVLDLCGIASAGIADTAKPFMLWIRQGGQLPEKAVTLLTKGLISMFGGGSIKVLEWVMNPASGAAIKQSFEQFAKLNADEGIEAIAQKYIKDFVQSRSLDTALNPSSITEKVNAGLTAAKIAVDDKVKRAISAGVPAFVKLANALIADGFAILLRNLLKTAVGVAA
jgi:hypothetical protein